MKNKYIRLISIAALASIVFLQGMWLYNTYKLLEKEFKKNVSSLLIFSVEKEAIQRMRDYSREKKERNGRVVEGFKPLNDHYTNNRALQDFIYNLSKEFNEDYPISLEKVDSIFKEDEKEYFDHLDYSFLITDSLGNRIAFINHIPKLNERFAYKETIQLRNIAPEYITLTVSDSYKIIFGKMLLMLIGSFILAIMVIYGLILQIRFIIRQNRIAALRQDFTYSMIHDIKNPITSILMGTSALKTGKIDDKPEMKERYYGIIVQEGERILRLANKILDIAKFEGQQTFLSKQQVNLSDLLREITEQYTSNAKKKVHFHIELNGIENIYADLHYIYEAFDNLIDNAIKYSKENEDAEIYITAFQKGNETQIIFKDMGIGISAKDQKKIFQKFERSMSVIKGQNKVSGFGLGLNFVYQIIKAHGGTIKVNSRLGSYSEFIINLPYYENNKIITD